MKKNNFTLFSGLVSLSLLSSCSLMSRSEDRAIEKKSDAPVKIVEAPALKPADLTQVTTSANVKAAHDEVEKQLSKTEDKKAPSEEMSITLKPLSGKASSHAAAHATEVSAPEKLVVKQEKETVGVDPEKALGWLKNGNKRFVTHHLRADGQSLKDVKRLAKGEHPHTIVLACSDSRVSPEIIFDEKLGELYVIRTAGESLDPAAIGSAEYALQTLGARQILVLGHTQCDAVKMACSTLEGGDAGSENMNAIAKDIQPRIQQFKGKEPSPGYVDEIWANTEGVADDLRKRSTLIDDLVKQKKIQISTAIYNLNTGKVSFK